MKKKQSKEAKIINTLGFAVMREIFKEKIAPSIVDEAVLEISACLDKAVEANPLTAVSNYATMRNRLTRQFKTMPPSGAVLVLSHLAAEFNLEELDDVVSEIATIIPPSNLSDSEVNREAGSFKQVTIGRR